MSVLASSYMHVGVNNSRLKKRTLKSTYVGNIHYTLSVVMDAFQKSLGVT